MSGRAAELLLAQSRPDRPRRVRGRELTIEVLLGCVVAGAAVAWPLAAGVAVELPAALACVVAYVASSRVCFYVGGGCALASQLALVPMLWTLPPAIVPACVAVALVAAALLDVARREPGERLLTAVGDAAYSFAPAAVLAAAGATGANAPGLGLVLAAFLAQCVFDAAYSIAREWLSRGVRPAVQVTVMATVWAVDALLMPLAIGLSQWTERQPLAVVAVLPFSVLLAGLARDRNRRLTDASDRLVELERERERVGVAIHRVARSLGAGLDCRTVLEVALGTAVDAVDAAAGRARLVGDSQSMRFEAVPPHPAAIESDALRAAERGALAGHVTCTTESGPWHAIARPLLVRREATSATIGAIAVVRQAMPFSRDEEDLFSYLAAQTAASIESIQAHERLATHDALDAATGLTNRQRFQDVARLEVERAMRAGTALTLLLVELDGFTALRDDHGDGWATAVLRDVGAIVRERCRLTDEPARCGGDRIGVILTGTTLDGAWLLADDIRAGIARSRHCHNLTASAGLAQLGGDIDDRTALVAAAEAALREAARTRDRTVAFLPAHAAVDREEPGR